MIRINVCDLPERFEQLQEYCKGVPSRVDFASLTTETDRGGFTGKSKLVPLRDGHLVSRESDFIIYSVEAAYLDKVVAQYGPCQSHFSLAANDPLPPPSLARRAKRV